MNMRLPRVGLRTQLLLISLLVLTIPWAGYRFLQQMESHLRQGQLDTLLATARAVATALHERVDLFPAPSGKEDEDLYVHPLKTTMQLDGYAEDWTAIASLARQFGADNDGPVFRLLLGKQQQELYLNLEVDSPGLNYCQPGQTSDCDQLMLTMGSPAGTKRYAISTVAPGWVRGTERSGHPGGQRIRGEWQERPGGYRVELRMPEDMTGGYLGVTVVDHNNNAAGTGRPQQTRRLVSPSPELRRLLDGLERTPGQLRVVDPKGQVLAAMGDLQAGSRPYPDAGRSRLYGIYRLLLSAPRSQYQDLGGPVARMEGPVVQGALNGQAGADWKPLRDPRRALITAAYPIWSEQQVAGAVVIEQTGEAIATIRYAATAQLLNLTLIVFAVVTLVLLLYASLLSQRIRRLRRDADAAVASDGRVTGRVPASPVQDELGELRQSFSSLVDRLQGYTDYLESMSSKLSHELRTPLAVVTSSLDNLEATSPGPDAEPYVRRAREGLQRLNRILTSLSEASRLEHALLETEREVFDLTALCRGCIEGYQTAYPDQSFEFRGGASATNVDGSPELMAQLLDKLISNARDFHLPGSRIEIDLEQDGRNAVLTVFNQGPPLPDTMAGNLFDSMVSMRAGSSEQPHLGLGLYIVRLIAEFHGGTVSGQNDPRRDGVSFRVRLPLCAAN